MAQHTMTFEVENGVTKAKIDGVYVGGGKSAKVEADESQIKDVVEDTVKANPEMAGDEPNLEGLELSGDKYAVPQGGGVEVVANPELSGTEANLTGLQVGDQKYAVPGTTLEVSNIESLTNEQCSNLKCGDIVIYRQPDGPIVKPEKNKNHEYVVSYKSNLKLNLTYVNTEAITVVVYNYTNNEWVYGNTYSKNIPTIEEPVYLEGNSGNLDFGTLDKIKQMGKCFSDYGVLLVCDIVDDLPVLSSVLKPSGEFYSLSINFDAQEEPILTYTITQYQATISQGE